MSADTSQKPVAVRLDQVSRHFGTVRALEDISLEIYDGEFFSMLGPSGSGKTTCLRLIAGFEQPSSGKISLHGRDVVGVPPYDRDVNTVFQDYALFPHMTVGDNVAYGLMIKKVPKPERERRVFQLVLPLRRQRRLPRGVVCKVRGRPGKRRCRLAGLLPRPEGRSG